MTFTTAAFDRSSSWQFEASSYTATPKGQPSSLVQHDAAEGSGERVPRQQPGACPSQPLNNVSATLTKTSRVLKEPLKRPMNGIVQRRRARCCWRLICAQWDRGFRDKAMGVEA
jgi:hypothetical protein